MARVSIERRGDPSVPGYVCPDCKVWSDATRWREVEVGCECCGTHSAMICPECDEYHDNVWFPFEDLEGFLEAEREAEEKVRVAAERKASRESFEVAMEPWKALRHLAQTAKGPDDEELACTIAEVALGWKPVDVPVEHESDEACQVLTPTGDLPDRFQRGGVFTEARSKFIPRDFDGPFSWLASIEGALRLAKEVLKPEAGLMWKRDIGGRFTLTCRSPLHRWSGSSGPHNATDPLAIVDAMAASHIDRERRKVEHTWLGTQKPHDWNAPAEIDEGARIAMQTFLGA
ncbi:hypothetical protein [Methylobacterium sp. A52T]